MNTVLENTSNVIGDVVDNNSMDLTVDFVPSNFVDNLYYMGVGMLCIFVVIGVIIGATALLNFLTRPRKKKTEEETEE